MDLNTKYSSLENEKKKKPTKLIQRDPIDSLNIKTFMVFHSQLLEELNCSSWQMSHWRFHSLTFSSQKIKNPPCTPARWICDSRVTTTQQITRMASLEMICSNGRVATKVRYFGRTVTSQRSSVSWAAVCQSARTAATVTFKEPVHSKWSHLVHLGWFNAAAKVCLSVCLSGSSSRVLLNDHQTLKKAHLWKTINWTTLFEKINDCFIPFSFCNLVF